MKKFLYAAFIGCGVWLLNSCGTLKNITYDNLSVPEEGGVNFVKISEDADNIADPGVKRTMFSGKKGIEWWINPMLALSPDGSKIAYLTSRNKMSNVMIKSATTGGSSVQRTFRNKVTTFSWSPDGTKICFTEIRNNQSGVYLISSEQGSIVQQISNGSANDYAGVMTQDGKHIFFHRYEGDYGNYSLWSYDLQKNLFSNYSRGMNPCLIPGDPNSIYCSRYTDKRECEIWKVNFKTGVEEVVLSQPGKSFTTPQLSPDGEWIVCAGSSLTAQDNIPNTDIYVVRTDGTHLTQLTYHQGNDLSPIWGKDGKSIYFISQRGSKEGHYNIWKMDFNL